MNEPAEADARTLSAPRRAWNILLLSWANMLWTTGFSSFFIFSPLYVRELGGNSSHISMIIALSALVSTLAYIPGGLLAERVERRLLICCGLALSVPAALLSWLAVKWEELIPAAALLGLSFFCLPAMYVYLTDMGGRRSDQSFALFTSMMAMGYISGPMLGGWLCQRYSTRTVFLSTSALWLLSALSACLLDKQRPPFRNARERVVSPEKPLFNRRFAVYCMLICAGLTLATVSHSFIVPFSKDVFVLSNESIGAMGSLVYVGMFVLMAPFFVKLIPNSPKSPLLVFLSCYLVSTFLLFRAMDDSLYMYLSFLLRGSHQALISYGGAVVGMMLPPEQLGVGFGIYTLAVGISLVLGPLIGGWLYAIDPWLPMKTSLVGVALILSITVPLFAWSRHAPVAEEAAEEHGGP